MKTTCFNTKNKSHCPSNNFHLAEFSKYTSDHCLDLAYVTHVSENTHAIVSCSSEKIKTRVYYRELIERSSQKLSELS